MMESKTMNHFSCVITFRSIHPLKNRNTTSICQNSLPPNIFNTVMRLWCLRENLVYKFSVNLPLADLNYFLFNPFPVTRFSLTSRSYLDRPNHLYVFSHYHSLVATIGVANVKIHDDSSYFNYYQGCIISLTSQVTLMVK